MCRKYENPPPATGGNLLALPPEARSRYSYLPWVSQGHTDLDFGSQVGCWIFVLSKERERGILLMAHGREGSRPILIQPTRQCQVAILATSNPERKRSLLFPQGEEPRSQGEVPRSCYLLEGTRVLITGYLTWVCAERDGAGGCT